MNCRRMYCRGLVCCTACLSVLFFIKANIFAVIKQLYWSLWNCRRGTLS